MDCKVISITDRLKKPKTNYVKDVHTEHCTVRGCKYGDEDCTVVTGKKPASYPEGDDW